MTPTAITAADVGSIRSTGLGGQIVITGTPTPGSYALAMVAGNASAVAIISGTFAADFEVHLSWDAITWLLAEFTPFSGESPLPRFSGPGVMYGSIAGALYARISCTNFTSGTPFGSIEANPFTAVFPVSGGGFTYIVDSSGVSIVDESGNFLTTGL